MFIGKLIRKFRNIRGLTQGDLGKKCNLNDVRIRQYELESRSPKDETLEDIAANLNINVEYLKEPKYPYEYEDLIRFLFRVDDTMPIGIRRVNVGGTPIHCILFLGHNILKIDRLFESWAKIQGKFMDDIISYEEYEDWKANWPASLEEDYQYVPVNDKKTSYKEYIYNLQEYDNKQFRNESFMINRSYREQL